MKDYWWTLWVTGCKKGIVFEGSTVSRGARHPYEPPCKIYIDENEWKYIYFLDASIMSLIPGNWV